MPPFFWVLIIVIVISTVVGAVAKLFANLNEMNANQPRARPPAPPAAAGGGGGGGAVRTGNSDMDRFLAEIDRLRKKTAEAPPPPSNQAPAVPVVQPTKQPDRPRPRVVAELAEPQQQQRPDHGFNAAPPPSPQAPTQPTEQTPPAVTAPPTGTGAPATRVTRIASRPRPVAKTPFAKNLTTLLNSGQGLALAIVLQEILGPAKCKKR